ncbi:MAG TPA: hypothetical protein VH598_01105 [Verrucomicrobiae bacterium]|jgi:hypothetical protein|nr:hypothetical protein [Verrucomicrobiae bacterium]
MRVVIQDRKSRLYFKGTSEWIAEINEAEDFEQIVKAIDFLRQTRLPHIDVLMHFDDPKYDVRLTATS